MTHIHLPPIRNVLRMHKKTMELRRNRRAHSEQRLQQPAGDPDGHGRPLVFPFRGKAFAGGFENPHIQEDLEALDKMPVPGDWLQPHPAGCATWTRAAAARALSRRDRACDGIIGVHEALRTHPEWRNVPSFGIDTPYWGDDHAIDYVAGEIKRLVEFVSKHTGKTLDITACGR